jgi:hypothetical protein
MGIDETKKLIDVLENGGLALLTVDFGKVAEEIKDLDWTENKELGIRMLELVMEVIASLNYAKNPVVSMVLPMAGKILKALS